MNIWGGAYSKRGYSEVCLSLTLKMTKMSSSTTSTNGIPKKDKKERYQTKCNDNHETHVAYSFLSLGERGNIL